MNVQKLFDDTDFYCGSTSATYLTGDKLRNINFHYGDVARLIWDSSDGWQYDDSNNTALPIVKTTLTNNTQDITLPSTAQRIHRIEIKDKAGTWTKLDPIDIYQIGIAMPEYLKGTGLPINYDLVGRSVRLYPTPTSAYCTLASGIAFYVDRDVTNLSAVSATPGFATPFHRLLSLGASIDFIHDDKQRQDLAVLKDRLEQGLVRFYGKRAAELPNRINPAGKRRWRQYL